MSFSERKGGDLTFLIEFRAIRTNWGQISIVHKLCVPCIKGSKERVYSDPYMTDRDDN